MKTGSIKPERKSTRLKGYDYSLPGAYFITIVTYLREFLFGDVVGGQIRLNHFGKLVERSWLDLPSHYPLVRLDVFVVMPNHVHGIVIINDALVEESKDLGIFQVKYGLSDIMRAFKSFSSRKINNLRKTRGVPVWQRSFYDRIIRNQRELDEMSKYIQSNPANWQDNEYYNYQ
jgi:REP-associated tyrosine transposase